MFTGDRYTQLLFFCFLFSVITKSPTTAQITPDNTLGNENSVVTENVTINDAIADLIEGGAIRDNNLFHSFSKFNVPEDNSVYFASPDGIANILTRVTGNNISEIFGKLGVNGAANLFLLNPNGIVFGENAALDLNGSFMATTADSYIFDNGFEYSASNPKAPPLLTINIPVGLQFGSQAESIVNRSLALDSVFNLPLGLQLPSEQTFTFLGGELIFQGGRLSVPHGQIELGSVAANSFVGIDSTANSWSLDYTGVNNFQDINLNSTAAIDASGSGGGAIALRGKQITLNDGSIISANTLQTDAGGKLKVIATEKLELIGNDSSGQITSSLSTSVLSGATGAGGDIEIITEHLKLQAGGAIATGTFGAGDSGNLSITAQNIEIDGASAGDWKPSSVLTSVFAPSATGKGGNLTIETARLQLTDGGIIAAGTLGMGNSGNLTVDANEIIVSGTTKQTMSASNLSTTTYSSSGTAKGGNLDITTNSLQLIDGGIIGTGTFGIGDGGDLTIVAEKIIARGTAPGNQELPQLLALGLENIASGIFSSVAAPNAEGTGGNLILDVDRLELVDGGIIGTGTIGSGDSGDLTINANEIFIGGISSGDEFSSTLLSSVAIPTSTGTGGDIQINADLLQIYNGGVILAGTTGLGDSGNLTISTHRIQVDGISQISSSGIFTSVFTSAEGKGGDITIDTKDLAITNGGAIGTGTLGAGDSGDLTITSSEIEISGTSFGNIFPSNLFSSVGLTDAIAGIAASDDRNNPAVSDGTNETINITTTGNGGNITIFTDNFRLADGGQVSASSFALGDAGSIDLQAEKIELTGISPNNVFPSSISAIALGDAAAGSISLNAESLNLNDRAEISVSNSGTGNGGNLNVAANEIILDRTSSLSAEVNAGGQGNVNLIANNVFLNHSSEITARATGEATGGNIKIDNTDNIVLVRNSQIVADAFEGNGGNINITSQGLFVSTDSNISASSEFGLDGNVNIETLNNDRPIELKPLPATLVDATQQVTASCSVGNDKFAIAGQGGLPENPSRNLRGQTIWQDLRWLTDETTKLTANSLSIPEYPHRASIIEAQTWNINHKGNLELIAMDNKSHSAWQQHHVTCGGEQK